MKNKNLLIIDDEENMRHMLKAMVERYGYLVTTAQDGRQGLEFVQEKPFDFILCDVRMPVMDGLQFLEAAQESLADSTVIMMSAFGTVDLAIEAMKAGAYDFISKPFKTDEVLMALKKAEEREQLRTENAELKEQIDRIVTHGKFPDIVAVSNKMKAVLDLSVRVAGFDTTVLITGGSGTGKELVARGIHNNSKRKGRSFVAINCGSLPESLLESELFGYVKGAFTGADHDAKGLFREADGGTILLDEIGELPTPMQVKLLRVLQEHEIRPVGSTRTVKTDVRVLAATSRDMEEMVRGNRFREDLFYRLNVVRIRIPPLSDREDDLDSLCRYFLEKYNSLFQTEVNRFSADAMKLVRRYRWPGNVRELENVVQRGIVETDDDTIRVSHLPSCLRAEKTSSDTSLKGELSIKKNQQALEASLIAKALEVCGGNKSRAARLLEVSYPSLLQKIKLYDVS